VAGVPGFSDLFGKGSIGEQLLVFQVLGQVISALGDQGFQELGYLANAATANTVLGPSDYASAVARGLIDQGHGADEARKNGIGTDAFNQLIDMAKSSPDLGLVLGALQRGIIGAGGSDPDNLGLRDALSDAGVRPQWWPIIEQMAVQIPTVAEVMNAWLEGQIEEGEAHTRYLAAGGDPTWFQTSYNANGQAPTPTQSLELLNRGIIPESGTGPDSISYQQAFLEGPWRNKWLGPFQALRTYLPPPRTVTAMFHDGQLTHDQAAKYLAMQGLDTDLIAAYLTASHSSATVTDKHLAKGDIVTLYTDHLLSKDAATTALVALKYSPADAALLLQVSDLRAAAKALTAGTAQVKELLIHGHIGQAAALASLEKLAIPGVQAQAMIDTWTTTKSPVLKTLTAAQIERAAVLGLISNEQAYEALQSDGYSAVDAWLALSIAHKVAITDVPRPAGSV
jgi:hypothetical protein